MKKQFTVAQTEEALAVLEAALCLEEGLTVALTLLSERHGPATQLAGLSLALNYIRDKKFPELFPVLKAVPKRLLVEFEETKQMLDNARKLAASPTGRLQ